ATPSDQLRRLRRGDVLHAPARPRRQADAPALKAWGALREVVPARGCVRRPLPCQLGPGATVALRCRRPLGATPPPVARGRAVGAGWGKQVRRAARTGWASGWGRGVRTERRQTAGAVPRLVHLFGTTVGRSVEVVSVRRIARSQGLSSRPGRVGETFSS